MKRIPKGTPGYIHAEKIKWGLITLILFAIPLTIFFTGVYMTGTRRNLLTVVAILGILPAARSAVSWIMIMLQQGTSAMVADETRKLSGQLVHAFELTVTAYEGRMPLDAVVLRAGSIAALSSRGRKEQFAFMEKHIEEILKKNGYASVKVKLYSDEQSFFSRIRSMADSEALLPEQTMRDENILRVIKAIAL